MRRRSFINLIPLVTTSAFAGTTNWAISEDKKHQFVKSGYNHRAYWVKMLCKIARPVLYNLSNNTLVKNMPVEKAPKYALKNNLTYLEAFGRTMAGITPWLSLPDDESEEGKVRKEFKAYYYKAIANGVNPKSPDYLNFREERQPIVDAAYLAQSFLRAPEVLWNPLDKLTKKRIIQEFKVLRTRTPHNSNWLIFTAISEIFLKYIGEEDWNKKAVDEAINKFEDWYVGDGCYSDGPHFAFDYYNSYVMQPMLVDTLKVLKDEGIQYQKSYDTALKRMIRYAEIQERMISPEGTFPVVGRSITYRTAAFQVLAMVAYMDMLPTAIEPAQVRCALTAIKKNLLVADIFDKNDWLLLGFKGHQPEIADYYTSTGSLYMTTLSFLPLGLPENHSFWSDPDTEWTNKKAWQGKSVPKDHKAKY